MGMDELETFVLDFLAYRREQRMKSQQPEGRVPRLIEHRPESGALVADKSLVEQPVAQDVRVMDRQPVAQGVRVMDKRPVAQDVRVAAAQPLASGHIPPTIGKGWPHYRGGKVGRAGFDSRDAWSAGQEHVSGEYHTPSSQNDIIPALAPVVAQALSSFGIPASPKDMDHLVNQVIASAMNLPPVSECVQTAELGPWGRVALLQAVIELLIRISIMQR